MVRDSLIPIRWLTAPVLGAAELLVQCQEKPFTSFLWLLLYHKWVTV